MCTMALMCKNGVTVRVGDRSRVRVRVRVGARIRVSVSSVYR